MDFISKTEGRTLARRSTRYHAPMLPLDARGCDAEGVGWKLSQRRYVL